MTYRLKNRNIFPPIPFQFVQPQMNWDSQKMVKGGTLQQIARAVYNLRVANPALTAKHGLSTDLAAITDEVDEYTSMILVQYGYSEWVQGAALVPKTEASRFRRPFAAVAGGVKQIKRIAAGVGVLLSWLGSGGRPVDAALAESRAVTCADCPQNGPGDWTARFTGPAAQEIRQQLAIKHDLKLSTSHDDRLRVCMACDCQLQLKVWVPLEEILKGTSDETKARLDPRCWITKEK